MFMTAKEIKQTHSILPNDKDFIEDIVRGNNPHRNYSKDPVTDEEAWRVEKVQAEQSDMVEDIQKHGVEYPVLLGTENVQDGHHRIAAARDDQLIPVEHTDDPSEVGKNSPQDLYRQGKKVAVSLPGFGSLPKIYDPNNPQHQLVKG